MNVVNKCRILFNILKNNAFVKRKMNIYDTRKTLDMIKNKKKSICRFGDGEFDMILAKGSSSQPVNRDLMDKMKEILKDSKNNPNCLVCIPYSFKSVRHLTFKSKKFWSIYLAQRYSVLKKYLNSIYQYGDSQVTRLYINRKNKQDSIEYFKCWKEIFNNKDVLIVEGELSRFGVGNDLLEGAKSVRRILCPSKNAFNKYEEIYNAVIQQENVDLVLFLLGPTATVLAYELSNNNVGQFIDIGNMDMEYEWLKQRVRKPVAVKGKYTYEVSGGEDVVQENDSKYLNSIILHIKG